MTLQRRLRRNASVRAAAIPAYRAYSRARARRYPGPHVLVNSFPKAGTHLVMRILDHLPQLIYSGVHHSANDFTGEPAAVPQPDDVDWAQLTSALARVVDGQYATGHFPADQAFRDLFQALRFRVVTVVRDPRDIAVSMVNYAAEHPLHPLHARFTQQLLTSEDRLSAILTGFPSDEFGPGRAPFGDRLHAHLGWLQADDALVLRFEDLVGPAGGGDPEVQSRTIDTLAKFVERPLSARHLAAVKDQIWSPASATFRSGQIGGWIRYFDPQNKETFKKVAGRELIALGYEEDDDW